MKKLLISLFSISILFSFIQAQEIIENPNKPLSNNAGRIVQLKEALRIIDEGKEYYFDYPRNIKIAPDGSLFVQGKDQLLQFDQNGKFIRNLFKKGQGPGELNFMSDYSFHEENIIVHGIVPNKIIWFDSKGNHIKEFSMPQKVRMLKFSLFHDDIYYFFNSDFPKFDGEDKIMDVPQNLISIFNEGKDMEKIISFPVKKFVVGGGRGIMGMTNLITIPFQKKHLLISYTPEYLVKMYDVVQKQVIKSFTRKYKRIKTPPEKKGEEKKPVMYVGGKNYFGAPRQKYLNDIKGLHVSQNMIWVVTSAWEKKKGILIDVFDTGGKFHDSFYLKNPEHIPIDSFRSMPKTISENFLYLIEKNEEEFYEIKKYKIMDEN